jgi:ferric-dicitrate binding protein FerR (iron transport regulator)
MQNEDDDATPEERAAAQALARALDGDESALDTAAAADDLAAANVVRAAAGRAPRLGDVAARLVARRAFDETARREHARTAARRTFARRALGGAALAVALIALVIWLRPRPRLAPALCSRPAGRLLPGPFPKDQSPSARLDLVTADRMIALRELGVRRARGRR